MTEVGQEFGVDEQSLLSAWHAFAATLLDRTPSETNLLSLLWGALLKCKETRDQIDPKRLKDLMNKSKGVLSLGNGLVNK